MRVTARSAGAVRAVRRRHPGRNESSQERQLSAGPFSKAARLLSARFPPLRADGS